MYDRWEWAQATNNVLSQSFIVALWFQVEYVLSLFLFTSRDGWWCNTWTIEWTSCSHHPELVSTLFPFFFEARFCYVAQDSLELAIFLLPPPEWRDYRCTSPCLAQSQHLWVSSLDSEVTGPTLVVLLLCFLRVPHLSVLPSTPRFAVKLELHSGLFWAYHATTLQCQ